MKKDSIIFVAGGTGLVGTAIINNLLAKGYTNVISNYHVRQNLQNGAVYYPLDLTHQQNVEYFFKLLNQNMFFLQQQK